MKFSLSMFRRGFNSSKCKTMAKMAVARIKLLRNKRQVVVRQMRRDIALLLQSGQDATARIRVEHVIREQNIMAANEIIELFCELIVARLSIISKRRECPADLKEGISSLIFSAPRCSEIPELATIRDIFEKKYGNEFVSAATDLRPSCGVNSLLIDKLSVRAPAGEVKLKVMKEIAKEYQIEWDTKETELELLKPPEKLIEGPATFVSASSIPINPKVTEPAGSNMSMTRPAVGEERDAMLLNSIEQAAEAGVKKALEAHSSVQLPNNGYTLDNQKHGLNNNSNSSSIDFGYCSTPSDQSAGILKYIGHQSEVSGRTNESQNFERSHSNGGDARSSNVSVNKVSRRHSYNVPPMHSDIKFDESDCEEEIEMEEPQGNNHPQPDRPPPVVPPSQATQDPVHRVHPKLPDYDALAARFEALKYRKS